MRSIILALLVAGCATKFEPQTLQGAQCKAMCVANTAPIDYNPCIRACQDVDRLAAKP